MSAVIAHFNIQDHEVGLSGSGKLVTVVTLQLPAGDYAVFGKVVITNADGGSQNAIAQLGQGFGAEPDGPFSPLDRSSARIAGKSGANHVTLPVQSGKVEFGAASPNGGFVVISCATWDGRATAGRLTALELSPDS